MKKRLLSLGGNGLFVTVSIFVILISFFSLYAVFLPVIGLLPGLIALVVDPYQGRYASKIVFSYNIVAVVQYLIPIISMGLGKNADEAAYNIVSNPKTWLIIYLCAAFGWFVYAFVPRTFIWISRIQNQLTIRKLQTELEFLVKEWGNQLVEQNIIFERLNNHNLNETKKSGSSNISA